MAKIIVLIVIVLFIYFLYRIIKSSAKPLSPEAQNVFNEQQKNKVRKVTTKDFKLLKKYKDVTTVKLWVKPNTNLVMFYQPKTYAGEGLIYKEEDKFLKQIIEEERDLSAEIIKVDEKTAYIKITYK